MPREEVARRRLLSSPEPTASIGPTIPVVVTNLGTPCRTALRGEPFGFMLVIGVLTHCAQFHPEFRGTTTC